MTKLWSIVGDQLKPLAPDRLESEDRLEGWLASDIGLLNPDLMLIGRQVTTSYGGRIDLLAINSEGSLSVIELKRDKTPRDIVAQVLDYASWVAQLDTLTVHGLADVYWRSRNSSFIEAFQKRFKINPPEPLNSNHNMVIVASALDPASQRIVEYLSQVHDVGINTAFFTIFNDGTNQLLSADWLMDQEEVTERTERRTRAPWTGDWYVNAGEGPRRSWIDMQRYGFISAGNGRVYSAPLDKLSVGAQIFAYQSSHGYVGVGTVLEPAVMAKDFLFEGKSLSTLQLAQPNLIHDLNNPELAEYLVKVLWLKTVANEDAKTFPGIFANPNVVCKLTNTTTLEFLRKEFEVDQP